MLNSVLQDAGFCWAWWVIAPIKTVSVCLHFFGINCDHGVLLLMYIPVFSKPRSYDRHLKGHLRFKAGKSIPQFVARCLMMQLLLHPTLSLEDISREIAMIFGVHYTMMIFIMLFVKKHSRLYQESIYLCDHGLFAIYGFISLSQWPYHDGKMTKGILAMHTLTSVCCMLYELTVDRQVDFIGQRGVHRSEMVLGGVELVNNRVLVSLMVASRYTVMMCPSLDCLLANRDNRI